MDENNKRDYSDFFKQQPDPSKEKEPNRNEQDAKAEQQSYYYSYGPFKSQNNEEAKDVTMASGSDGTSQVEITAPRPARFPNRPTEWKPSQSNNPWEFQNNQKPKPKKKSRFTSYMATFLAGALVVGSLMFASDRLDLFGGAASAQQPAVPTMSTKQPSSNNGGVTTAAMDNVVRPGNISEIVNQASPAVVKITTYVKGNKSSRNSLSPDDFFDYFFGNGQRGNNRGQANGNGDQRQQAGMGSGFIFEDTGYILTNQHVIDGADEVEVEVQGYSKPFTAKVLGSEYGMDLAVIKIEQEGGKPFSKLEMGSSDDITVGEWVVAIGNPYGFDHTVTVGVLSAKERPIDIPDSQGVREYKHLLQTDASINPGNSGGPLLNLNGQVVGINTAVSSQAQGIGFAIPTSTVQSVLENLKNNVKVPIPFIGVGINDIQEAWVEELKISSKDGVLIASIQQGAPAEKADLQPYDVVTEVNGKAVKNVEEFRAAIKAMQIGDKATLTVMRNGTKMTTAVIIADQNKI